jgi:V/A-type H+/Na+-transporting ATPase subunit B
MIRVPVARTIRGAAGAGGPLLFLESVPAAALGEWVRVRMAGQPDRRGRVIEAGRHATVVQLLDEAVGLAPDRAEIECTGEVATTPVGRDLLGRAFDGHGAPVDGLPPVIGEALRPVDGQPLNPVRRAPPRDVIETGLSAIDGLNTLVRGQKLPVFGGPGLPALALASRIVEWARPTGDEPFAVVFAAIGITAREVREVRERLEASGAMTRTVLYLNEAAHPAVERLLAPRLALTAAEWLAFEAGYHVLVVMADLTHYCEALREVATAREEVPGRRGFPGYMYTDLASLYERAGIVRGRPGSVTQVPVLTMPDDDITHPIPDLTGYITEGQLVLGRELHRRGVAPPIDVLPSLSRLMGKGIGPGRTRPDHREWSDQLYALYARGRDARPLAAIVGLSGLPEADRRALDFAERFEREFVGQGDARRTLDETFAAGWRLMATLPRSDCLRIADATWAAHVEAPR